MKQLRHSAFIILLGVAAEVASAGPPGVSLESGRIDGGTATGLELGRVLVVEGRRMALAGGFGKFLYQSDDGSWVPAGFSSPMNFAAMDEGQVVWGGADFGQTAPWSDSTVGVDFMSSISTPDGGTSVAVSGDSLVLGDQTIGRVRAFLRTGDSWSMEFEQVAASSFNNLGSAVDLDGSRLVFSATQVSASQTGVVYSRFRNPNGTWIDFGSIIAPGAEFGNAFGMSVSASDNWLAVGAPFEDTAFPQSIGTDVGAVYLFETNSFGFYQHRASIFGTQDGQHFGMDVELEGGTLVVGAPGEDVNQSPPLGINRGAAYVYWRNGDTWSLHSKLSASDGSNDDGLGTTVEIAELLVFAGAPLNDGPNGADTGTIYIYSGQVQGELFSDGFESGNAAAWSTVAP